MNEMLYSVARAMETIAKTMVTWPTLNKTKDWALVQNAALVGVEVSLG